MCGCHSDAGPVERSVTGLDFVVTGMSCGSCATKVTEAVRGVPGVTDVEVDVATGRLTVAGDVRDADVTAAVSGAGYATTRS
ncbi:heavy-metal-associated domain-containing protein [Saccharothrix sp. SC076]|nr:heavy-metal-associated domain-containing protein [Saccharothrix obliqua]